MQIPSQELPLRTLPKVAPFLSAMRPKNPILSYVVYIIELPSKKLSWNFSSIRKTQNLRKKHLLIFLTVKPRKLKLDL